MQEDQFCPLYVDYVRECAKTIGDVARELDTLSYCTSERHTECPFLRYINNRDKYCAYFAGCPLCKCFKNTNFKKFVEVAQQWCLKDCQVCKRYQIRQSGESPPDNLMPDGSTVQ